MTTLTLAVQEQLLKIAMPLHLQYSSPKSTSSPDPATGRVKASAQPSDGETRMSSKKRKMTANVDDDKDEDEEEDDRLVKRASHNIIEKRYRIKLNDSIAVLRDSVPSLQIVSKITQGEDTAEDHEELHGLTPAHNLNKVTVCITELYVRAIY
jgi:DNA-nicking Smr family endonuclease